ncbi:MAG: hypothetical protein RI924_1165 [Bacteroidota bacterium]
MFCERNTCSDSPTVKKDSNKAPEFACLCYFCKRNLNTMSELIKKVLDDTRSHMDKAIDHCENEIAKIRAGKAMPSMLDGIMVDYYGTPTPLSQVGNVNTPDARTLVVQPWEKTLLQPIEKAIMDANIGLNPQNDGTIIRLNVPPLTEERRRDLVKKVKEEAEKGRIAIRNIRKDANEKIKKLKPEGVSDDEIKTGEAEVQKLTDAYIIKVDKEAENKEKDIMTV